MQYFVKRTPDGGGWFWCYAASVRVVGNNIVMDGARAPMGADSRFCDLFGGHFVWPADSGLLNAFPIGARPWIEGGPAYRVPRELQEMEKRAGLDATINFAMRGTMLARYFENIAIRRAVGEDMVLGRAESGLRTPQFLPDDDVLFTAWSRLRPEAARFAVQDADRAAASSGLPPAVAAIRRALRCEAHRKIDAARENFAATPGLGGEPWVEFPSPAGSIHYGRVSEAIYTTQETSEALSAHARNEQVLQAVEDSILPGPEPWKERIERLEWQRKFSAWEAAHMEPSLGYRHWGGDSLPPGFVRRDGMQGPASDYSALGMTCLLSEPAVEFLAKCGPIEVPSPAECAHYCLRRAWSV